MPRIYCHKNILRYFLTSLEHFTQSGSLRKLVTVMANASQLISLEH